MSPLTDFDLSRASIWHDYWVSFQHEPPSADVHISFVHGSLYETCQRKSPTFWLFYLIKYQRNDLLNGWFSKCFRHSALYPFVLSVLKLDPFLVILGHPGFWRELPTPWNRECLPSVRRQPKSRLKFSVLSRTTKGTCHAGLTDVVENHLSQTKKESVGDNDLPTHWIETDPTSHLEA